MAIPEFTEFGLLPEGIHSCSTEEAAGFLCTNEHRTAIWQGLQGFVAAIAHLPTPSAILVDGSFVTDKPLPGDADVIIDISNCNEGEYRLWADFWSENFERTKEEFRVDFYPVVAGLGHDFSTFFQYVRIDDALQRGVPPTTRKGILKVQL
jgi:hypothetical protein